MAPSAGGSTPGAARWICAVIPVHDEAVAIAGVVETARRHVAEVIVFDDGSTDGSAGMARQAGARVLGWAGRRGKGSAVRAALEDAFMRGFQAAVILDGDGQHLAGEIPRLLAAHLQGAELVVGDRTGGLRRMPPARRLANIAMTALLRPFAGSWLRDSQCGFRLLSARVFRCLDLRCERFDADSEVLIEARRLGVEGVHVPISVVYGDERSKIRWVPDALRFVRLLLRAYLVSRATRRPSLPEGATAP